jgi:putative SOS response-associated peptidase YedK
MCGRYASSRRPEELIDEFEVTSSRIAAPLEADFNVAPTKEVYAVVERPRAKGEPVERQLRVLRWGLVPSWAKEASIGSRLINARMETVAEKPAFRRAFAARRCLLPADGYYEWYETSELTRAGKPKKQPFYIHPADGGVLAMAGLYELWTRPPKSADGAADPADFLWSCTVITTDATDDLGRIHDRMPLMVSSEHRAGWLDPSATDPRALLDLLEPAMPGRLEAYPVSTAVGNVQNNGPGLVKPLPVQAG